MKRKMENVEVYEMLCGLYNMIENSHDAICDGPNPADRSRLYPLMPIVVGLREEYREKSLERYFRGDAAFANPDIYEFLEEERFFYAIRLKQQTLA